MPTVRTCKVHGELTQDQLTPYSSGGRKYYRCRQCTRSAQRRVYAKRKPGMLTYKRANKDRIAAINKRSYAKRSAKAIQTVTAWQTANKAKVDAYKKRAYEHGRNKLADWYVRRTIRGTPAMVDALIQLKRVTLQLYREIRLQKQASGGIA